ncbi:hypothetical protein LB505_001084 [Fusarium chuoi]|nr:hypothetical protein LB505_001084 [Fusarium chuoi]
MKPRGRHPEPARPRQVVRRRREPTPESTPPTDSESESESESEEESDDENQIEVVVEEPEDKHRRHHRRHRRSPSPDDYLIVIARAVWMKSLYPNAPNLIAAIACATAV